MLRRKPKLKKRWLRRKTWTSRWSEKKKLITTKNKNTVSKFSRWINSKNRQYSKTNIKSRRKLKSIGSDRRQSIRRDVKRKREMIKSRKKPNASKLNLKRERNRAKFGKPSNTETSARKSTSKKSREKNQGSTTAKSKIEKPRKNWSKPNSCRISKK